MKLKQIQQAQVNHTILRAAQANPKAPAARLILMLLNEKRIKKQWHKAIEYLKTVSPEEAERLEDAGLDGTFLYILTTHQELIKNPKSRFYKEMKK